MGGVRRVQGLGRVGLGRHALTPNCASGYFSIYRIIVKVAMSSMSLCSDDGIEPAENQLS